MKQVVYKFILLVSFFVGASASGKTSTIQPLTCSENGPDAILTHVNQQETQVTLPNRRDVCEAGFEFMPDKGQPLTGLVLAAPIELGLHAKNTVFRVSFQDGMAKRLGELPVSAVHTSSGSFVDVFQEGGSVFLERYEVSTTQIKRTDAALELVIDGHICVQQKNDVWIIEISDGRSCRKRIVASASKPRCVVHEDSKAMLSPRQACKELEEKWRIQ